MGIILIQIDINANTIEDCSMSSGITYTIYEIQIRCTIVPPLHPIQYTADPHHYQSLGLGNFKSQMNFHQ